MKEFLNHWDSTQMLDYIWMWLKCFTDQGIGLMEMDHSSKVQLAVMHLWKCSIESYEARLIENLPKAFSSVNDSL